MNLYELIKHLQIIADSIGETLPEEARNYQVIFSAIGEGDAEHIESVEVAYYEDSTGLLLTDQVAQEVQTENTRIQIHKLNEPKLLLMLSPPRTHSEQNGDFN